MADAKSFKICTLSDLEEGWGEVALVEGHQYAVFRTAEDRVFITDHKDPNSGALVIARGILGKKAGVPTIASPLYKEEYNLETGECVNGADFTLPVYPSEVKDGEVYLSL